MELNEGVSVIAEIGVNHNGNINLAIESIKAAKESGADIVKFQTFKSELGITVSAPLAEYQKKAVGVNASQYEMIKNLELSDEDFYKISAYCKKIDIEFMSTAFDIPSLELILNLGVKRLKIPSGDIDNVPLLQEISKTNLQTLVSTGMSGLDDINFAISLINPNQNKDLIILQCTTEYPCPPEDINLAVLPTLEKEFKCKVGFSDHSNSIEIPALAVAAGACVIEKHFTLNKSLPGPDHNASLNPNQFREMINRIRFAEIAYGSSLKELKTVEFANKDIARKSIVAKNPIKKGDYFTNDNLTMKRPAGGLQGSDWFELIGKRAKQDYRKDALIKK